jgi:phage pi2 protein 07
MTKTRRFTDSNISRQRDKVDKHKKREEILLRPDKRKKLSVAAGITRAPNQKKELFLFQLKKT